MRSSRRTKVCARGGSYAESDSDDVDNHTTSNEETDCDSDEYPHGQVTIHKRNKKSTPKFLVIKGVKVEFPGTPYETQIKMMKSVIEGLDGKKNNLIESPTGTGKTLALLCSILAWRESVNFKGKIYYTTRTHSQVSGVIKELKKTAYVNRIITTILGSRKHLCINTDKPKSDKSSIDAYCHKLRLNHGKQEGQRACRRDDDSSGESDDEGMHVVAKKKVCKSSKSCSFYYGTETGKFGNAALSKYNVLDMEDYKRMCAKMRVCPYYTSMNRHSDANLIVCPYNYIVSRKLNKTCKIDLKESLVIFDEGHNLEKACCDEASISIRANNVTAIKENVSVSRKNSKILPPENVEDELVYLEKVLHDLVCFIKKCSGNQHAVSESIIFKQMNKIGLGPDNICDVNESLQLITDQEFADKNIYLDFDIKGKIASVVSKLSLLYSHCDKNTKNREKLKDYQLFFSNDNGSPTMYVKCMNPAVVFRKIEKATTSVTITSGTLAPLSSFPRELGSTFHNPISLDQAIPSDRYLIMKVGKGPTKKQLCLNARNRLQLTLEVGKAVLQICKVVPNGVILFAPSKVYLSELERYWNAQGILERIRKYKHIFNETDKTFINLEAEYKAMSQTGALLLSYFRGSMSEGVDFKDEEARAVITLGIPLMPYSGAEANARKTYYNDKSRFQEWYETDAFRAFNQGIGRCVRHPQDWGAVIMMDSRLILNPWNNARDYYDKYLPKWISTACSSTDHFAGMIKKLKKFVNEMEGENEESSSEEYNDSEDDCNEEDGEEADEENMEEERENCEDESDAGNSVHSIEQDQDGNDYMSECTDDSADHKREDSEVEEDKAVMAIIRKIRMRKRK